MLTDIEIAKQAKLKPVTEIATKLGLETTDLSLYGDYKAKIKEHVFENTKDNEDAKLILVTSINPTRAGEGKSTVTVGLVDSLNAIGKKTIGALREPSMGPVFGLKGGATGGGYAQVGPMEDINLHFTGDMHAITSSHNLITACMDSHIFNGNELEIDVHNILWKRVLDVNDRNLRSITVGHGKMGVEYTSGFEITVASEIMAIFCLAQNFEELRTRIEDIILAYNIHGKPVFVRDLNISGSIIALLKDAFSPNLVQTFENNPVLIHGGPFANIAHGCNSLRATKLALKLSDYVVTEAGFGADLGSEKFVDIKSQVGNLSVNVVAIVATVRALKLQGGADYNDLTSENLAALQLGFANLDKHIETVQSYGASQIVLINKFATDTDGELELLKSHLASKGITCEVLEIHGKGSEGGIEAAQAIVNLDFANQAKPLYTLDQSFESKLTTIVTKAYGASGYVLSETAKSSLEKIKANLNVDDYFVCMAKTPASLTDDPNVIGRPTDFEITITDLKVANGSKFIVCYAGGVMTMPGLGKVPNATRIDVKDNEIIGLM
ncbi:formate--tetrahydrofolate ligase [Mollicutes bacterium LVI A0039]|nr:formate--tetrahydrofolate ligase [Mollicutes bacterium LVI A0039]